MKLGTQLEACHSPSEALEDLPHMILPVLQAPSILRHGLWPGLIQLHICGVRAGGVVIVPLPYLVNLTMRMILPSVQLVVLP